MATYLGNDGIVMMGGNTIAKILSYSYEITPTFVADNAIGDAWSSDKVGRFAWTGTIEVNHDPADTTGQGSMTAGTELAVDLRPQGTGSGLTSITGTAKIGAVSFSAADETLTTRSYPLQGQGALVEGAQA